MAAIPDSRSRVEWFSRDVIGWKQKAPWISLYPASCFVPCLSSPPPNLIFHPDCALLVLWTHCCPLQEKHVSLLLLASVMAALVEEGCLARPSDPEYGPAVTSPSRKPKSPYEGGLGVPVTMSARLWALIIKSKYVGEFLKRLLNPATPPTPPQVIEMVSLAVSAGGSLASYRQMTQVKEMTRACKLFRVSLLAW